MAREIDINITNQLDFTGFGDPDPNNALLVFEHEGEYHFYQVSMNPLDFKRKKLQVPNYKVIHHEVRCIIPENLEQEVEAEIDKIEGIKPMLIKEIVPLSGDLQYKLDCAVVLYLLCMRYLDEEGA